METQVLNIRVATEDLNEIKSAAEHCGMSANALASHMVKAAVAAVRGYRGPMIPMTLEFPPKIAEQNKFFADCYKHETN